LIEPGGHPVDYLPELAMGVLPDPDAGTVRAHVDACESCTAELAELERVTRLLPFAAEAAEPVPGARDSLMERIAAEPRGIRTAPSARRTAALREWLPIAAAAGFALLALGGVFGFLAGRSDDDRSGGGAVEARLLQSAAQATLQRDAIQRDGLAVSFVRAPGETAGFAWVEGLPALPEGKAYQAWFTRDGASFEPSTVFSARQGGVWLPATAALDQYAAIGFTIEDDAGAKQPTQAPFAVMPLQAAARRP